jgi:hypothetical protein
MPDSFDTLQRQRTLDLREEREEEEEEATEEDEMM